MATLWLNSDDGKLITDASGLLRYCDTCPCDSTIDLSGGCCGDPWTPSATITGSVTIEDVGTTALSMPYQGGSGPATTWNTTFPNSVPTPYMVWSTTATGPPDYPGWWAIVTMSGGVVFGLKISPAGGDCFRILYNLKTSGGGFGGAGDLTGSAAPCPNAGGCLWTTCTPLVSEFFSPNRVRPDGGALKDLEWLVGE